MEHKQHILVVDDEFDIREPVGTYLAAQGFEISLAGDADTALSHVMRSKPDLAILDIMIGQDDGFSLYREMQKHADIPVIFLSGKTEETERIIGLELGADDYIVKPFSLRELLARVRAILRRSQAKTKSINSHHATQPAFGRWRLDTQNQELIDENGERVALSTGEVRLLEVFLEHPNKVLNRDQLIDFMHGRQANPFDRSIDNYVSRVRKKIEEDPSKPRLLKTYWGGGYALICE